MSTHYVCISNCTRCPYFRVLGYRKNFSQLGRVQIPGFLALIGKLLSVALGIHNPTKTDVTAASGLPNSRVCSPSQQSSFMTSFLFHPYITFPVSSVLKHPTSFLDMDTLSVVTPQILGKSISSFNTLLAASKKKVLYLSIKLSLYLSSRHPISSTTLTY